MKTDKELKQIAMDLADGKIFSDRHMAGQMYQLPMVFMPIALGSFTETANRVTEQIDFIYEYLDKAGPRCINGMPMFTSLQYLVKEDSERMFKFYEQIMKFKKEFAEDTLTEVSETSLTTVNKENETES